jgi:monoamine oxidase
VLDYCRRLNVALEPFIQLNHNALLHVSRGYGSKPQRIRAVGADFQGHVSELLAKATRQRALDAVVSKEDQEILLEALKSWGALDANYAYTSSLVAAARRGYAKPPGGGQGAEPIPGTPLALPEILQSRLWRQLQNFFAYDFQTTLFQPVGGMDAIGKAFARELGGTIQYNAKVMRIQQEAAGIAVTYTDADAPGAIRQDKADWCICTIPLSILSQIEIDVGAPMRAAIEAVPYIAAVKVGLQFKRRFWEEDEAIYGGISYTDLPITQIAYPNSGFNSPGRGVLLGAYPFGLPSAYEFTALTPPERVARAVEFGAQLHPQYRNEFENGVAVAWNRMPFTLGCAGYWTDAARAQHYENLCRIDSRIALAGEHASYIPAWQEGAILSALDAVTRLHQRVIKS